MQVVVAAVVAGKGAGSRPTPWSPVCSSATFFDRLDYFFDFLHRKQLGLRLLQVVFHADGCLDYFFEFLHRK
jgi:hypothetical protein